MNVSYKVLCHVVGSLAEHLLDPVYPMNLLRLGRKEKVGQIYINNIFKLSL
jgi:hypothetical protein